MPPQAPAIDAGLIYFGTETRRPSAERAEFGGVRRQRVNDTVHGVRHRRCSEGIQAYRTSGLVIGDTARDVGARRVQSYLLRMYLEVYDYS